MEYYNVYNLLEEVPDADFYIIIGQRSNGKSTSVASMFMDKNQEDGSMFAYFTRLANISIIKDMEEGNGYFTGYLEKYALEKYHKTFKVKDNAIYLGENPLCKQFSISLSGKYKSKQYDDNYKFILFEEFVSEDGVYIRNEWQRFNSVISTITRNRGCKVFLIGNTVSRFNPYFENFGIDVMQLGLKAGEHKVIKTPEGATVCIDFAGNVYQSESEIASVLKVQNNEIATTTEWMQSDMVLTDDIITLLCNQYKCIPVCIIALQTESDAEFYNMYCLQNDKNRIVCNILTKKLLCSQEEIDSLDLMDFVYYIDVKPVECAKYNVKSYVDLQRLSRNPDYADAFNQVTFFEDDKIRHQYHMKLNFNEPSERIGDKY